MVYLIREGCPRLSFSFTHASVIGFTTDGVTPFRTSLRRWGTPGSYHAGHLPLPFCKWVSVEALEERRSHVLHREGVQTGEAFSPLSPPLRSLCLTGDGIQSRLHDVCVSDSQSFTVPRPVTQHDVLCLWSDKCWIHQALVIALSLTKLWSSGARQRQQNSCVMSHFCW